MMGISRTTRALVRVWPLNGNLALTAVGRRGLRHIVQTEGQDAKGKPQITIEGVQVESDRKDRLVQPQVAPVGTQQDRKCNSGHQVSQSCHPFCRFNFVHEVKHTDVLILAQFMDTKGVIMDRETTGLCLRQHQRVNKLIKMAAKAGLFPKERDQFRSEKESLPGANLNSYYDEKTIDIQHLNLLRKKKRYSWVGWNDKV